MIDNLEHMNNRKKIIILGGGQAAAYAANEIRKVDAISTLTMISDEEILPYERPPLSKDYLLDKITMSDCLFYPKEFYVENNINFIANTKIDNVNFNNKEVRSLSGEKFYYDKLLIATGSSNRKLQVNGKDILHNESIIYLRNSVESKILKDKIKLAKNIIIIGGGFIGLEIASSASQLGKKITIIERTKQLMGRVIPTEIANLVQKKHEQNGTTIKLNVDIEEMNELKNSHEIILKTGEKILADLVIVGIGSLPNTSMFSETDIKIENGVITDEFGKTSVPDVFAAGDVANFFHPFYNKRIRLESFKHAQNHGINAGKNMLGIKTSYNEIPWMWSDQFELNLQLTGLCNDYETTAQRGLNVNEGIIYFFLKNRRVVGACGIGVGGKIGRDIRLAGKLSEKKIKVTKEILSDKGVKLNKII